ncbi:hypothetical protein BDD43_2215 [Mucilaginibacter gracilis]|uniref:Uncharacterized protein n=1 Tax=Mucilaginibacter gracilis TaxID=423350 RepID=A0A495J128_9SPHI|nr:hypothetical protein BDD43_2215 [Mucilaginibacter gracilis]
MPSTISEYGGMSAKFASKLISEFSTNKHIAGVELNNSLPSFVKNMVKSCGSFTCPVKVNVSLLMTVLSITLVIMLPFTFFTSVKLNII